MAVNMLVPRVASQRGLLVNGRRKSNLKFLVGTFLLLLFSGQVVANKWGLLINGCLKENRQRSLISEVAYYGRVAYKLGAFYTLDSEYTLTLVFKNKWCL